MAIVKRSRRRSSRRKKTWLYTGIFIAAVVVAAGLAMYFSKMPQRAAYPFKYKGEVMRSSEQYGLDPCLVAAVIYTESGFDPEARSSAGAIGLMQLMPETAEWAAGMRGMTYNEELLTEPQYNIDIGCWLLNYLLNRCGGNRRYALIAYNAGYGTLESWLADEQYLDENGDLAVIPYGETDAYVKKVESSYVIYLETYGDEFYK